MNVFTNLRALVVTGAACLVLSTAGLAQSMHSESDYRSALPLYQYSSAEPFAVKRQAKAEYPKYQMLRFSYASAHHERVPALLYLPVSATKLHPAPCLVILHGAGGSKEQMAWLAEFAAQGGYAALVIDEYGQGERRKIADSQDLETSLTVGVPQTVIDVRRGLDYLTQNPAIDHRRFGILGVSLGAMIGAIVSGVDPRIKASVLISGGGDWALILKSLSEHHLGADGASQDFPSVPDWGIVRVLLTPVDPLTFAGRIAPRRVLMENGRLDQIVPPAAAQELYDALSQPANAHVHIDWFADAGHVPRTPAMFSNIKNWLQVNL